MKESDVVSEELANGKWIAYISGRIQTPVAKGKTKDEANENLENYLLEQAGL